VIEVHRFVDKLILFKVKQAGHSNVNRVNGWLDPRPRALVGSGDIDFDKHGVISVPQLI
jgi:hypothetical protein